MENTFSNVSFMDVGIVVASIFFTYYVVMPFMRIFLIYLVKCKLISKRHCLNEYGTWAVITGSTDGIGKAYAEALAKMGLNIVLISRTKEKLDNTARELEKAFNVKTKTIVADFTRTDIYDDISAELKDMDIGTLINNVGMSVNYPDFLVYEADTTYNLKMVNCNIVSVLKMTECVLPGLVSRDKGGAIINIASFAGTAPLPLLTVYSSTKVFVDFYGRALNYELGRLTSGDSRIIVQSVLPMFVTTKMSKITRPSFTIPTPEDYVESALNLFGVEDRTYGYLGHSLLATALQMMPSVLQRWITFNSTMRIRNNALRKLKRN